MDIKSLFPSKEQITNLRDIESVLLSRKTNGKIAGWVALLSALVQFAFILWPIFNNILGFKQTIVFSSYFHDLKTFIPFVICITGILIYLILRRTSVLLKETKEPFRYTLSVKPFLLIGNTPESDNKKFDTRFILKNQDRLLLLHHDLTELINQRIKRFSIIPQIKADTPDKKEDDKDASAIDKRKSSHIDIFGTYAVREDKENDEWIIHVMPYVRIGPPDSAATLAQSIRFSLSKDETPETLDTNEYNQLVERVYSRVTTEIYARIEKDIQDKIELFPTRYLKANALYHEARDMANSNTINAFESAINLYNESISILKISLVKKITGVLIKMPLVKHAFVRYLFQCAKIYIGHAKCLIYRYRISTLSGRKRNPIFEILSNLEDIIIDLEYFHYCISRNSEISNYRKSSNRSFSILAYLTYPEDSFLRQILFKPSQSLFAETRKILFNAYVVHSLTDSLLNAFVSARKYLDKAKAIAPDLSNTDSLYFLAQAYAEPNVDRALLSLQKATEIAPSFQIAQYDLAFWLEMKFRMNDEIKYNRARSVLDEYDKVLRINPGNVAALAAQGYMYWLLYDLDEARWLDIAKRKFEEGYEIKAIASETFIGQLMYGCARIFAEQGKINKCYDLFNQAFTINPNLGSYTVGEDSWLPCSFYDYIYPGLLKRYKVYYDTYVKFLENKKFIYGKIGIENIEKLDKNELPDNLKKVLKKTGNSLIDKNIKIITEEATKKWIIKGDENNDTIHIHAEDNGIEVYSKPDVSEKALDTVYSYILNDYANANYNYYRRNGNDHYLKVAIDLYSKAIDKFPDNSISKFNMSFALLEQNKTEDAAILLDEVLENRPTWYEALIASVTLNLDLPEKIDKIKKDNAITQDASSELKTNQNNIKNLNNEIKKLQEKSERINDLNEGIKKLQENSEKIKGLNDQIKKLQETPERLKELNDQIKKLQEGSDKIKDLNDQIKKNYAIIQDPNSELKTTQNNIKDLNDEIKKLQGKSERLKVLSDEIKKLQVRSDRIKSIIKSSLDSTKLFSLYDSDEEQSDDTVNHINLINKKSIKWVRLDEDDVHALKLYSKYEKQNPAGSEQNPTGSELFRILLKYYCPEDIDINLKIIKDNPESMKMLESNIQYWLDQDPSNYFVYRQYKANLGELYFNNLGNYIHEGYEGFLKLLPHDETYTLDNEEIGKFFKEFEEPGIFKENPRWKAYVYYNIGKSLGNTKNYQGSIEVLTKSADFNNPEPEYYYELGLAYTKVEQWNEAINYYKQAIERKKKLPDYPYGLDYYYDYLSEACFRADRLIEFLDSFEKSGDLNDKPEKKAIVYNRIGNLFADLKKEQEAIPYYKKAIEHDPHRPIYLLNLGLTFKNLGQWDEAIKYYRQAVEFRRQSADDLYDLDYYYDFLSEAYFKTGKLNEFLDIFEKSGDLNDKPVKKAIVYNRIGNLFAEFKKEQEAIPYYEKAIGYDPNRPIYLSNLGLTYTKLEQWEEAIEYYKKAIELSKKSPDDQYGLDYYYDFLSEVYFKVGRLNEFLDIFETSGDLNDKPDKKAIVYNRIGNLFANSAKDQEAIPYYKMAIEHDPDRPIYLCNLGLTYEKTGQWNEAIEYHKQAIDLRKKSPDDQYGLDYYYDFLSEAYFKSGKVDECLEIIEGPVYSNNPVKKALVYDIIGNSVTNPQEAIPYYKKSIEYDPDRPIYLCNLGLTYAKLEQWNDAIEYYRQAILLREKSPDDQYGLDYYYDFLSEAYFKANKLNEFLENFEKSGDLNDKRDKKAIVYNRIGNLFANSAKEQEAIPFYKKAIEYDPDRPIYLCNLGLTYANLKQWNEAVEYHKQAVEIREKSPDDQYGLDYYYDFLSEAYFKSGKLNECLEIIEGPVYSDNPVKKAIVYNIIANSIANTQEAVPYYKKAIEYDPNRPIYLCNLGLTYAGLKQWDEALKCYQQAVELRKQSTDDPYTLDYYNDFLSEAYNNIGKKDP